MKNSIIIIRGLPGAGKSSFANLIKGEFPVYSIDDYFTDSYGVYHFNHKENYKAYQQCEENVRQAMKNGIEKILVDNVFSISWEMEPYLQLAKEYNYTIYVLTIENYHGEKNKHDINDEQLKKMEAKYKVKLL